MNEAFESEESSGVTTMAPVPAKPLRLSDVDEKDRTAYFSVTALVERGKAVAARDEAARAQEPPATLPPPPATLAPPAMEPDAGTPRHSVLQQLRDASPTRKATLVVLALLVPLAAMTPVFDEEAPAKAAAPEQAVALRPAPSTSPLPSLAATPEPLPPLPKGVTLERAASDALVAGDFARARRFYEALSQQKPNEPAYREAARILERRLREGQQP